MDKMLHMIELFSENVGRIISLGIILMVLSVGSELGARAIIGYPFPWTFETTLFIFGSYTMLLAGFAFQNDAHVRMDILYSRASSRTKAILDIATFPFFFTYTGVILWLGAEWAYESYLYMERSQTLWGPILFPFKATIPLGAVLLLLAGVARLIRNCARVLHPDDGRDSV